MTREKYINLGLFSFNGDDEGSNAVNSFCIISFFINLNLQVAVRSRVVQ